MRKKLSKTDLVIIIVSMILTLLLVHNWDSVKQFLRDLFS